MKKLLLFLLVFNYGFGQTEKATVGKENDVLVFIYATPEEEYEVLGEVHINDFYQKSFEEKMFKITEKAKKIHHTCDAIIIKTKAFRVEAEVIRFKPKKQPTN